MSFIVARARSLGDKSVARRDGLTIRRAVLSAFADRSICGRAVADWQTVVSFCHRWKREDDGQKTTACPFGTDPPPRQR